jgi:hypothetical protein
VAVHERADAPFGLQVEGDAEDRMVEQVLADRQIGHDRQAEPAQQRRRAEP